MYTNIEAAIAALEKGDGFERFKYSNFRNNKRVVMVAIKRNGFALAHASKELKADREVILVAINSSRGHALRYASDELGNDKEFVLKAMSINFNAFGGASSELKDLCKGQDPIEALTKAINYEKLTKKLAPSVEVEQPKRKLKI